jgi:hypothetical protein
MLTERQVLGRIRRKLTEAYREWFANGDEPRACEDALNTAYPEFPIGPHLLSQALTVMPAVKEHLERKDGIALNPLSQYFFDTYADSMPESLHEARKCIAGGQPQNGPMAGLMPAGKDAITATYLAHRESVNQGASDTQVHRLTTVKQKTGIDFTPKTPLPPPEESDDTDGGEPT